MKSTKEADIDSAVFLSPIISDLKSSPEFDESNTLVLLTDVVLGCDDLRIEESSVDLTLNLELQLGLLELLFALDMAEVSFFLDFGGQEASLEEDFRFFPGFNDHKT